MSYNYQLNYKRKHLIIDKKFKSNLNLSILKKFH